MSTKRSAKLPSLIQAHKRFRLESGKALIESQIRGSSSLPTPIVRLEEHQSEIFSCKFHPRGDLVLSAGFDKEIHIGDVFGENGVFMVLDGHTGPIMEAQFSTDGSTVYSGSMDKSVAVWDTYTGTRITQLRGHEAGVNSVQGNRQLWAILCSGSDDHTIRLWDVRQKCLSLNLDSGYQVTAACFNERGDHIISAGVDNDIKLWDIRTSEIVARLQGHEDVVSGISLSPCGSYLLSNSVDNTLRIWDIRPFVSGERCKHVYTANQYITEGNLLRCAWSRDGKRIAFGGSDHHVYVWDIDSNRMVHKLSCHESSVNDVDFHPTEPIIVSASSHEHLYMHELKD